MASAEKRGKGPRPWRARYKRPDGTWGSEPGFSTKAAAVKWGNDQEAAIRAGSWVDPHGGMIHLDDWWAIWLPAQEYAPGTIERLTGLYTCHLSPWRGDRPIGEISVSDVSAFEKALRAKSARTYADNIMSLLRMLLDDAAYEQRLRFSPVMKRRRRGRRNPELQGRPKRPGVAISFETFLALAKRLPDCGQAGPKTLLMIIIAYFTGLRWGELYGMQRKFLMLMPGDDQVAASGWYVIDDRVGALHIINGGQARELGPPKGYVGRTVDLPPFLVELLLIYTASLPPEQELLFVDGKGQPYRRDGAPFDAWRRACDGWKASTAPGTRPAGRVDAAPIHAGLHWHDLRHSAKTLLVDLRVPAVARDERLGHGSQEGEGRGRGSNAGGDWTERGAMDHVYVHTSVKMRADLLAGLQGVWTGARTETRELEKVISRSFPSRSREGMGDRAIERIQAGQE